MLLKLGWPAEDLAGYVNGEAHAIDLDQTGWDLRTYQDQAAESFWHGGSGVVVLTLRGRQDDRRRGRRPGPGPPPSSWSPTPSRPGSGVDELIRRTSLTADEIGEYPGRASRSGR